MKIAMNWRMIAACLLCTTVCEVALGQANRTMKATFFGEGLAGEKTASGERFDPKEYVAAHRELPFGTRVKVTNPETGKSVEVRVIDRGPKDKDRDIDISKSAAKALGMKEDGVQEVWVDKIEEAPKGASKDN